MSRILSLSLVMLLLVGCQSTELQTQYYQLADAPKAMSVSRNAARLIIEPVILVDFLKRPNILLKQPDNTLYVTNYQVWAEPLDKAIARAMVNHINQDSPELRAEQQLLSRCEGDTCFRLQVFVEGFYPLQTSQVEFSGKYTLYRGTSIHDQQDFNLINDLEFDGYPHAVMKLQDLIYQLSSQIKQKITTK